MGIRLSSKRGILALSIFLGCLITISHYTSASPLSQTPAGDVGAKPGASPTPQPSPVLSALTPAKVSTLGKLLKFLKCERAKRTKEQELSLTGPQFPHNYDDNDFSIVALVQGEWEVDVEYELELEGNAVITFTIIGGKDFSVELPTGAGGVAEKLAFVLPAWFGAKPQPALISFKALGDGPNGLVPADFQLKALGIGGRFTNLPTSTSQPDEANAFPLKVSTRSTQQFQAFATGASWPSVSVPNVLPGAVRIDSVNVDPGTLTPVGEFQYSFDSSDDFSRWNADYYRKIRTVRNGRSVSSTVHMAFDKYNELVFAGRNPSPPSLKKWKIPKGPRFPAGEYKIQVTAFLRADGGPNGGKSATRFSRPLKIN
jgi:hypothetical protein